MSLLPPGPPPDPDGRRRVHPVSPLVHAAAVLPVVFIAFLGFGAALFERHGAWAILIGAGVALLAAGLVAGYQALAWQRLTYWFDADGDLRVDSGVLQRQQRRLQLSRLQGVDVVQPLVARLTGLAAVKVEVAGVGDSRVQLAYLTLPEAQALRSEVLARAAGLRPDVGEAPEQVLVQVPNGDLLLSLLLRTVTVALLLLSLLVLVGTVLLEGPGGLLLVLVTGGVPLFSVVGEFLAHADFTVAESPDGLRLRSGLLQRQTRTVPPGRVQAVGYVEPLLWRRRGWIRIELNVAGVGGGGEEGSGGRSAAQHVLLPVAPREVARAVVARVLPGVDVESVPLRPAPRRSRRRSPVQWSRLAVGWDDRVFVARRGRLTRHLAVVPHARTQSVRVTQGPWERALGLASMHVDSTPGPVRVSGLRREAAEARRLAQEQSDRARAARRSAGPQRWMQDPGAP